MIKILKYLKTKEWLFIFLCTALIVFEVWLELKLPEYMTKITNVLTTSGKTSEILKNGGIMIACALASGIVAIAVGYFAAMIGCGLAQRLRSNVYGQVATFSPTEMNKFSVPSLITRSTNDISQIQQSYSMGLQVIIKAPIMAIWAICKISTKNFQWSLATAIAVGIILIGVVVITLVVLPKFKIVQKQTDDLNKITTENMTGLRVIRAFNAENYVEEKFNKHNSALTKTHLFTSYGLSFINPIMYIVMNGLSLAIYVIGAYLINAAMGPEKILLFGDMASFFSYAMQIIAAFMMMVIFFMILPRAQVSARRITEVLNTKSSIKDGEGATPKEIGTVKFDDVTFGYPDAKEPVIKNISFEAKQGEMVAIIGATGSGKSTIIQLIPRLYDATSGNVYVDGENVKKYKLHDLYSKIGYISQKSVLFSGTINSNVSMGEIYDKKAELSSIKDAIKNAQSADFVENMENTYDANILQGGSNLSGGQKQRLAIARALARNPEILIFDDSFSALDYQTDKNLRTTLKENLSTTTCIIVAQRIGTIKNCDKIIVIDDGKIAGTGTHEELLENCDVYKEIALSQLSKEELGYGTK
ncbi:MAG: ABC transporter ATP-binding protein [Clostridia bacterium]|nr:ABC transporter ATP-binding protein [Clostridia bacterium]